jgi:heptosyltransferase-2
MKLLVRLPNWVGDVIMALPALEAIKNAGIEPIVFGKPWAKELLHATGMRTFAMTGGFWHNVNTMMSASNVKNTLLLTNSLSSAISSRLARKIAVGYNTDQRGIFLKHRMTKLIGLHEVEYFWRLAKYTTECFFNIKTWPDQIPNRLSLPINSDLTAKVQSYLAAANIHSPFTALCPFAQGRGKNNGEKIWPYWRELTDYLHSHHQQVVVCPGPNEVMLCDQRVPNAHILSGLSLSEYAAVLSFANRAIANDSGPMHLATAMGTPTLGIFGVSDPNRTRPWGGTYIGSQRSWPSLTEVLNCLGEQLP